ncbi:DNA-binding protein [Ktedonosporobacter rubrisoli]|uniref:DNA-binding protein n=1 Tax=Ktedonosporobacter rubrisoli TaxID=2509675 RepID=A0A4P6K4H8_KTERU|nr:helix-turn-helix domain-containing protein [Ktedonosporobacter rubrisoli]QBD83139.1 DNA-binding protein [Ktedonosporobacter rubrisoli]
MDDILPLPDLPDYVDIKEAAKFLNVAEYSIHRYIQARRLEAYQVGNKILIKRDSLEQFKPAQTGRPRKHALGWRISPDKSTIYVTYIRVQIHVGKQEQLENMLAAIRTEERHLFTGTMERYISIDDKDPAGVTIQLVWRGSSLPGDSTRAQELVAFKQELEDVLDWSTAHESTEKVLIHT